MKTYIKVGLLVVSVVAAGFGVFIAWIKMENEEIVDGIKPKYSVEFLEERRKHIYVIDGSKYASVTNVLNIIGGRKTQMLMNWSKKIALNCVSDNIKGAISGGTEVSNELIDGIIDLAKKRPDHVKTSAGDFGTKAHDLIDNWIKNKTEPADDDPAKPVFEGFMKYLTEHKLNIVSGDIILGSRKDKIGGRADLVIKNEEGEYCIVDFKTSNFVAPDYHLQVSAYAKMLSEQYDIPLSKKCYIVKFLKDKPEYEVIEVGDIERNYRAFLAAKELKETIEAISF